ncbi:MAG: putative maltokinase [Chthoniobacteraceae bacterium]
MSVPTLRWNGAWESLFDGDQPRQLEALLPAHLRTRRWFAGKARTQRGATITDTIPIPTDSGTVVLMLIRVDYLDAETEIYTLPVGFAAHDDAARIESESPTLIIAHTDGGSGEPRGILYDATGSAGFAEALLDTIIRRRTFHGAESRIECSPTSALEDLITRAETSLTPKLSGAEQSNSSIRFGDRLMLKLFRRPEDGINPEVELGRALTARRFKNAPPLAGTIEYRANNGEQRAVAVLHGLVAGAMDGWEFTLEALRQYYNRVRPLGELPASGEIGSLTGSYIDSARLLGQRTAEMHLALAADREHPGFAPEPFTLGEQDALCESMRGLARNNLRLLNQKLATLTGEARDLATSVIASEGEIIGLFHRLADTPLTGLRIRIHGDYHLGQTLRTGGDFFIVDFEGEPSVPLSERRMKRTPFTDVAGLLRSFDYAAHAALRRESDQDALAVWAERWTRAVSAACLESYLSHMGTSDILPASAAERALLLDTHLLRKAVYEIGYEANNRPDWLPIPCRGILALLGRSR